MRRSRRSHSNFNFNFKLQLQLQYPYTIYDSESPECALQSCHWHSPLNSSLVKSYDFFFKRRTKAVKVPTKAVTKNFNLRIQLQLQLQYPYTIYDSESSEYALQNCLLHLSLNSAWFRSNLALKGKKSVPFEKPTMEILHFQTLRHEIFRTTYSRVSILCRYHEIYSINIILKFEIILNCNKRVMTFLFFIY
jgi:hypothetical protein